METISVLAVIWAELEVGLPLTINSLKERGGRTETIEVAVAEKTNTWRRKDFYNYQKLQTSRAPRYGFLQVNPLGDQLETFILGDTRKY